MIKKQAKWPYEMKPIPTIGVIVFRNDKSEVLLVRHGEEAGHLTGSYGTPSGRIEENENPKQAAARELKEETGLETTEEELIPLSFDFGVTELKRKNGTMLCTWEVFICKSYRGEVRGEGDETTPEWVEISKLENYWLLPSVLKAVKLAKEVL